MSTNEPPNVPAPQSSKHSTLWGVLGFIAMALVVAGIHSCGSSHDSDYNPSADPTAPLNAQPAAPVVPATPAPGATQNNDVQEQQNADQAKIDACNNIDQQYNSTEKAISDAPVYSSEGGDRQRAEEEGNSYLKYKYL